MDPFTRKRFETLLRSARNTLMESMQALDDPTEDQERHGEPMDEGDVAVLERQREALHLLRNRYVQLYWEIQSALKRLQDGEYGICERCGDSIQTERLEVQPTARLCIDCQRNEERRKGTERKTSARGFVEVAPAVETTVSAQWRYPECGIA
ncbi:MAG: TraR/DksA family transcriptional regulator [Desulfosoma sp.]|uniref:TraR/DksA family transcriptional regulator n=1 Tax=Desulfosoma sp. TaxID=2603217 RepID=UPI0040498E59